METIIILVVVNLIGLLALGREATRSAAGYVRLLIAVAVTTAVAGTIAAVTGETRVSHSATSQIAASLLLAALASALTVAIATVRFVVATVAALVAIRHERIATRFLEEARKSDGRHQEWCWRQFEEHMAASKEVSERWLYAE